MTNVFDVARYIVKKVGPLTALKLQKLVYYSQVWSLVWDEKPLFAEQIEAWANGPVCRTLYDAHSGLFEITEANYNRGKISHLTKNQKDTIDAVLKHYGSKTGQYLSELTHKEMPWKVARGDLPLGARCTNVIPHSSMHDYYSSLTDS